MKLINNKMLFFSICYTLFCLTTVQYVVAAPTILNANLGASGTESSISGSSFGNKIKSGPVLFERFEDNVQPGQSLQSYGVWAQTDNTNITYDNSFQRTSESQYNIVDKLVYGGLNGSFLKNVFPDAISPRKIFISFWSYTDVKNVNANNYWQLKYWRLTAGPVHGDYPQISVSNWYYPDLTPQQSLISLDGTTGGALWNPGYKLGQWAHTQLIIQESSGVDVEDGSVMIKVMNEDGSVTIKSKENIATRTSSYPDLFRWIHFGYFETNNLNPGHEVHTFWDDIYIDDSWARVEIGNQDTYTNCTHLELQKILSWSQDSITFVENNGSFQVGQTAYLYVIDADGNISNNGQGFKITIGEGGGNTAPSDQAPSVSFTAPTTSSSYALETARASEIVTIEGTAADDKAVQSVTYSTDKGQSGSASSADGFATWSVPVTVNKNETVVTTVTVTDDAGQRTSKTMSITCTCPVAWDATVQTGDSTWTDSGVTYCVRLLVEGNSITDSAGQVVLGFQGRSSGDYTIRNVSIAQRDPSGSEGDVIDSTWQQVTFDNAAWNTSVTVPAGTEKTSDPVTLSLQPGADYYVTFKIDTPSVYLDPPAGYRELYFASADHTGDVDWSGTGFSVTQDYHALAKIYVYTPAGTLAPPAAFELAQ